MTIVAFVSMEIFISKNVFDFLKALFWGAASQQNNFGRDFSIISFSKTEHLAKKKKKKKHLKHKTFCETFKTSFEMS